jgi:hypothetical protein
MGYIQISNFKKHQNPHKNEAPSVIPAPSEVAPEKHSTSTVQIPNKHTTNPADSLSLDSLNLIPDSLNPISSPAGSERPGKPKVNSYTPEFEEVYTIYPRKEDKKDAFKAWNARLKEGIIPEQIITAAKNYIAGNKASDPSYFKMLKTFLGPGEHIKFWLKPPENTVQQKLPRGFQDILDYGGPPNDH